MAINARTTQSYERSKPTCKFCDTTGHTMASCPTMQEIYESTKTLSIDKRSYKENYAAQYLENRASKKKPSNRAPKKCGYCRETGHSRRSCPTMVKDRELIAKGNKVWRRMWAENSKNFGLTPASLLKLKNRTYSYKHGGYIGNQHLCAVGAELPENLTVFAIGEDSLRQEVSIPIVEFESGTDRPVSARRLLNCFNEELAREMFSYSYSHSSGNVTDIEIVVKSNYEYSDSWFDKSPDEDTDFALKKWSKQSMNNFLTKVRNLIYNHGGKYGIQ
jgi:hypothetical protein